MHLRLLDKHHSIHLFLICKDACSSVAGAVLCELTRFHLPAHRWWHTWAPQIQARRMQRCKRSRRLTQAFTAGLSGSLRGRQATSSSLGSPMTYKTDLLKGWPSWDPLGFASFLRLVELAVLR